MLQLEVYSVTQASYTSSQKVLMWENWVTSPISTKEGIRMVRCFDCCNLIKYWKPTAKLDWLFEEKWKCNVTDEQLVEYYLIEKERECPYYEKRPRLLIALEDLEN